MIYNYYRSPAAKIRHSDQIMLFDFKSASRQPILWLTIKCSLIAITV